MRNPMADRMKGRLLAGLDKAARLGAAAAKLAFDQREGLGCTFEAGRLKAVATSQAAGFHAEVVVEGKRGAASGNRPDELDAIIERATALARLGSVAHFDAYPAPAPTADVKTCSERTRALSREDLIDACRRIADTLKTYSPDLFIHAGAGRGEAETLLVTSGGVCHGAAHTHWSLEAYVQRTEGTDILFAGEGRGWKDLNELWDPDWIAREILEDLRQAETAAEAPSGKVPALLSPHVVRMLLGAVAMGTSGRAVAKGESPLAGRLGERILDPCLTIRDDPHLDFCPGASAIDGDGVPTRPLTIVREGVLEALLYDLDSAGLAGAAPTGHNGCAAWWPEVLPGEAPHGRLLEAIDDGLYIKALMGFGQSNLMNGDFSANVALGYRVRGGRLAGRVKDLMVAGNVYDLLGERVRTSADRHPFLPMPWAAVEGLSASAARKA